MQPINSSDSNIRFVLRYRPRTAQQYLEDLGNGITLAMLKIFGGTFLMGSPTDEPNRSEREGPEHSVTVPDFFLGKYPITQGQWRALCALPPVNPEVHLDPDPSHFTADFRSGEITISADQRPVERVNWHSVTEVCDRLAQATGRPYSLPSEAQWEYACRAGTTSPFHFGETLTSEVANYDASMTYGYGPKGQSSQGTTPVGHFPPNGWGLHDMHGNVWEWCTDTWPLDVFHSDYEGAPTDGSAWITVPDSNLRALRGGSWYNFPRDCRSAVRLMMPPNQRGDEVGFRMCCTVTQTL